MTTYISILRGINVGGKNKLQMDGLKDLYKNLKFKDVITYIQSGNIIFKTKEKKSNQELSKYIEEAILEKYKFKIPVIIRSLEEMNQIVSGNPLIKENEIDIEKLHVTFLSLKPDISRISNLNIADYFPDRFVISGLDIYLYCPKGYGISKLSNTFFENKLKATATTRNWNTVNKLLELARE